MPQITYTTKGEGDLFTPANANEIKLTVNANIKWNSLASYSIDELIPYIGITYKSLQNVNNDNTPVTDGGEDLWWEEVKTGGGLEIEGVVALATIANTVMYFGSDGKLHTADNREFVKAIVAGVLIEATTTSDENSSVLSGGALEGFTGLTPGLDYYLGNSGNFVTKGAISYSEFIVPLGRAISSTSMDIKVNLPHPTRGQDDGSPIGTIVEWGGEEDLTDIPMGWKSAADGDELSRANFPELNTLMSDAGYPWGDGDGSTTFNLPKGFFDSGWLSTSTWASPPNTIVINHEMKTLFDSLEGHIFVRNDSIPGKIYVVTNMEMYPSANPYGQRLNEINNDLNHCNLQLFVLGGIYSTDAGTLPGVPTSGWSYKVNLNQKGMSKRSIIKAEHVTSSGETVSALRSDTGWINGVTTWQSSGFSINVTQLNITDISEVEVHFYFRVLGSIEAQDVLNANLMDDSAGGDFGVQSFLVGNNINIKVGTDGFLRMTSINSINWTTDGVNGDYRIVVTKPNLVNTAFDVANLSPTYDISAVDVTKNLTVITGLPQVLTWYWIDGDATFKVTPTTSDGATINGRPASDWVGEGTGHMTVESDGSSNWRVREYEDKGTNVNGTWTKLLNGDLILLLDVMGGAAGAATNTLPFTTVGTDYSFFGSNNNSTSATDFTYKSSAHTTTTIGVIITADGSFFNAGGKGLIHARWLS